MAQATWWHFYQDCADSAWPVLREADEKEWPCEGTEYIHCCCYHLSPGLLSQYLWPPACMGYGLSVSSGNVFVSIMTLQALPQYNPSCPFVLHHTKSLVSRKRTATCLCCLLTCCVWSMMLSSNTARVYPWKSLVPSAHGPTDWQIGGSYRVKLFRVLCLSMSHSFWHCLCMLKHRGRVNALCMTVSVTQMCERK